MGVRMWGRLPTCLRRSRHRQKQVQRSVTVVFMFDQHGPARWSRPSQKCSGQNERMPPGNRRTHAMGHKVRNVRQVLKNEKVAKKWLIRHRLATASGLDSEDEHT